MSCHFSLTVIFLSLFMAKVPSGGKGTPASVRRRKGFSEGGAPPPVLAHRGKLVQDGHWPDGAEAAGLSKHHHPPRIYLYTYMHTCTHIYTHVHMLLRTPRPLSASGSHTQCLQDREGLRSRGASSSSLWPLGSPLASQVSVS